MNNIDVFSVLKSINDADLYKFVNQITAACLLDQDIYLGTKMGVLHKFEHQQLEDENQMSFVTSLLISIDLLQNFSIDQLEICGILNMLVALTNETLIFINENPVHIQNLNCRLKGVTGLSVKEGITINEEYVTEMCVSLNSKKIQLYLVSLDRLTLLKEINIMFVPIAICLDHDIVCIASSIAYKLLNISTEAVTDLFSFQSGTIKPKIAQLPNKGGVLLRGPDGLGIFADANGASQRPPIQWGSTNRDFMALKSYIVVIDNEFITVHDIKNQQQIQTIHYPNQSAFIVCSKTKFLVISNQFHEKWDMIQLVPLTWNQQANQYLCHFQTDKAISIVNKHLSKPNFTSQEKQTCDKILSIAGFHKFRDGKLKEAKFLFEKSRIDLREIINCYSNLLPKSYKYEPQIAKINSGFHLSSIFQNEKNIEYKELEYRQFLLDWLIEHRDSSLTRAFSQVVETALVKLYVTLEPQKLFHNFTMMLIDVDYDDLVDYFTENGHFHACAMVMQWYGQIDRAVIVWSRLVKGEISDPIFPGIEFLKEVMSNISDPNIIAKNIDWLLEIDPSSTSEILKNFIDRFKNEHDLVGVLLTNEVMSHIRNYPDTLFDILFELCLNGLLQNHSQHEHLANIFIKKLSESVSDEDNFNLIRMKFQQFLRTSDNYPTQKLLTLVREFPTSLLKEESLILGQMGEHEVALEIIIKKLFDFNFAEQYCLLFEDKNKMNNGELFLKLLSIYLSSNDLNSQNKYKDAALDLLQKQAHNFNTKEVLKLLPDDWPLDRLRQFLLNSAVIRNQTCFTIKMKSGLEKIKNKRTISVARGIIQKNKLVLEEWKQLMCSHCGQNIDNCSFIRTQTGQVLHKYCFNCA